MGEFDRKEAIVSGVRDWQGVCAPTRRAAHPMLGD